MGNEHPKGGMGSTASVSSTVEIKAGFCNADPITTQGKRIQMAQMLSIPLIPFVILVVQTIISFMATMDRQVELEKLKIQIHKSHYLGNFIKAIQVERGETTLYASFNQTAHGNDIRKFEDLEQHYIDTDETLSKIDPWPVNTTKFNMTLVNSREDLVDALDDNREMLDNGIVNAHGNLKFYSIINNVMIKSLSKLIKTTLYGPIWRKLLAHNMILRAIENYGSVISFGVHYFNQGYLDNESHENFVRALALAEDHLKTSQQYSKTVAAMYGSLSRREAELLNSIADMIETVSINKAQSPSLKKATIWLETLEKFNDFIHQLDEALLQEVIETIDGDINKSKAEFASSIIVLVFVVITAPVVLVLIHRLTSTIQNYALGLSFKTKELRREKKRSDTLLYQMLPKSVALQLKLSKRVAAESFNAVTIYFSDIVGFTSLSAKSSPMEVVDFLNQLYFFFDSVIDLNDVYKVETIGDAYMVASGVPQRNGKRHAGEIANMSMDLLEGIKSFEIPHLPDEKLKLRIGLHTGPVVAGVVGSKMPRYCLFGSTVTIASNMEAQGVPMKIHISEETRTALGELEGWTTYKRGIVDIKGRGPVDTFFLKGRVGGKQDSSYSSLAGKETPIVQTVEQHMNITLNSAPPK